jgi:hypothetical protein
MDLEKIHIDENVYVYKGKINLFEKYNQMDFIKKIEYLKHLYPEFILKQSEKNPGNQYPIYASFDELDFIYNKVKNVKINEFKTTNDCIIRSWVYMSDNKNVYSGYHNHLQLNLQENGVNLLFDTTFTFTYYLQMPDNLSNNDGYLYFKTDNVERGFLPKEDEVWIFPPNLMHEAKNNKNSNKKRIVIASNIHFFDYKSAKLNKTIF